MIKEKWPDNKHAAGLMNFVILLRSSSHGKVANVECGHALLHNARMGGVVVLKSRVNLGSPCAH